MSEILISFELMTILYLIILIPTITFLTILAYRIAKLIENMLLVKWNNKLINDNKKVLMEAIQTANELIETQKKVKNELELNKKIFKETQ